MGSGFDNGAERPAGGGRDDGLPGLPADWGTVVIPDDPAELSSESDDVRRQLRRARRRLARRNRWRRLTGRPISSGTLSLTAVDNETPTLALPLMIMAIAVVASLVSLFALSRPAGQALVPPGITSLLPSDNGSKAVTVTTPAALPNLVLVDSHGNQVSLAQLHPAVLMLAEACSCEALAAQLDAALDPGVPLIVVRVIAVDIDAPARVLADPEGALRAAFISVTGLSGAPPATGASVLLVDQRARVIAVYQQVTDVSQLDSQLAKLTA
jgi:hypothetical protein